MSVKASPTSGLPLQETALLCPSAPPELPGSRVLGVVTGTAEAPEVAYLDEYLPVDEQVLALAGTAKATQVLRFAAPCQQEKCSHFDGTNCNLVTRVVQMLPQVVDILPACLIRGTCRWFAQEGREACRRCPQVVTYVDDPTEQMRITAEGRE